MGFFRRNWRELLVAGIVFIGVMALAIAAPYLFPFLFAAALASLAPAAGVAGTAFATATFYGLSLLAAAVGGILAGSFTSLIRKCCSSPSADQHNNVRAEAGSMQPVYEQPYNYNGQQQAQLATNFIQAPQHSQPYTIHMTSDPMVTTRGTETHAYLKTYTGEIVAEGTVDPRTNLFTALRQVVGAARDEHRSTDLQPVYTRTNK